LAIETCIAGAGGNDDIVEAGVIRTGSNLWYVVFESILVTLGLDTTYYETRKNLIDESLVRRRNNIAHGKEMDAKPDEFVELRNKVLDMMDHFAVQVFISASQKDYLERAPVAPLPSRTTAPIAGT
jgi:RiboL-PSP-HEPN